MAEPTRIKKIGNDTILPLIRSLIYVRSEEFPIPIHSTQFGCITVPGKRIGIMTQQLTEAVRLDLLVLFPPNGLAE